MVTDLLSPLLILPYLSTSPPRNLFLNLRTFSPLSLARTVLFSSLGIIVRWSIGVRLLSSAEAVTEDGAVPGGGEDLEGGAAASSSSSRGQISNGNENANANDNASETTLRPLGTTTTTTTDVREDDQDEREQDGLLVQSNGNGNGNSKGKRASILKKSPQQQQQQNERRTLDGHVLAMDGDHDDDEDEATKSNGRVKTYAQAAAVDPEADSNNKKNKNKKRRVFQSFPNTPIPSVYSSSSLGDRTTDGDDHDDEDDDDDESSSSLDSDAEEWGYRRGFGRRPNGFFSGPRATRFKKFLNRAWKKVKRIGRMVREFMTVPLWAAVLSLAVACIPPVQHTLNKAEPLKACVLLFRVPPFPLRV